MPQVLNPNYFKNNLKRLVGLYGYAINNKDLDKISEGEKIKLVITDGLKLKSPSQENIHKCRNTINYHFGGLEKIRSTPLWKMHIDVALAVFNNRLQVVKDNAMIKDLASPYKNPFAVMLELFKCDVPTSCDVEVLEKIYNAELVRKNNIAKPAMDYKIACSFLSRIPMLNDEEVKQLLVFIIQWMIKKSRTTPGIKGKKYKHSEMLEIFNKHYHKHLRDLGPECEMMEDVQPAEVKRLVYEVWPDIDERLPVLHPDMASRILSPNEQNT